MKKISIILASLFLLVAFGNRAQAQCTDGNSDCYIVISCTGYSYSWNYSTLTIAQNGTTLETINSTNYQYPDTVRICTANGPLSFNLSSMWNYESNIGFSIVDSMGVTLFSCTSADGLLGDFLVDYACADCLRPVDVALTDVTPNSATLSWRNLGGAPSFSYCVTPYETPDTWQNTTDTSVTVSGLSPNTRYNLFVFSNCISGDSSAVVKYAFRTACGTMQLPYTENFEQYDPETNMPFCWTRLEDASGYPNVYTWGGHTGDNSLYFYPNYGYQSVVSPLLPQAANTLEMILWMQGEEEVQVGYITSLDPNATIHPVTTIGPSTDPYEYEQYTIRFDSVTADSVYIVLRCTQVLDWTVAYIDDITFREINNCPIPSNLVSSSTAAGEVALSWNGGDATQWQIAYGPSGFDLDTTTVFVTSATASTTITGLDNGTTYDFYVRSVCGTQPSYWSDPVTTIPYIYIVPALAVDTIATCGRMIVDDGGLNATMTSGLTQTLVLMPSESQKGIHLQGRALMYSGYSSYYPNVMRIFAGSDTTGRLLASINSSNVNIDLFSEVGPMTIWISPTDYEYYTADGFQFYISCEDLPECTTPYNLEVSNIGGNGAVASWQYSTALGEPTGFTLTVTDGEDNQVGLYTLPGSARNYTLTGLSERTFYRVQLNVDCEGTDSLVANFATICNNGGEMEMGDGTTADNYLPSYLYYGNTISQQLFTADELTGVTTIYGFQFYCTTTGSYSRLVDVYMDTTDLTSYHSTNDYVVMSDDKIFFSGTLNFENGWVNIDFDSAFTVPAGKNIVLTFNDHTNSYVSSAPCYITNTDSTMAIYRYRDNTSFDPTDSFVFDGYGTNLCNYRNTIKFLTPCGNSSCIPPTIVSAVPGQYSVELAWMPSGTEEAWKVEYRSGSGEWTEVADATSDTTYTIFGLLPATTYTFRVSSICGEETSSRTVSATTLCAPFPLPFVESFVDFTATDYGTNEIQMCWNRGSLSSYGSYYPYTYDWYSFGEGSCLSFNGYRSYIVLPEMGSRVDSLNISFYAMNSYPQYYTTHVEVGVCTDPSDTSTFTVLSTLPVMSGNWELIDVDLENYTAGNGRIFIRSHEEDYSNLYVDSIIVSLLPDCRRVNDVTVSNITTTTATVNIVDNHSYGNYIVYYGTENDTIYADTIMAHSATVSITDLVPNTEYYVWVASQCSDQNSSKISDATIFRTNCEVYVVTDDSYYLEEFEGSRLDCMNQESENGLEWVISSNVSSYYGTPVNARSGGSMGKIAAGNDNSATSMLILPTFDFTGMTEDAAFSFYRFQHKDIDWDGEHVHSAGHLEVYYRVGVSGNWTLLSAVDSSLNSWNKVTLTLPASQGAALYQVAVKGIPGDNYDGIYVDDFKVSKPSSCFTPTNVTVSNITDRTAVIKWEGGAPAYKVQYRAQDAPVWNARMTEGVDSLVIAPLDMATLYDVRVTSVCSPYDFSDPSDEITFSTEFCTNNTENQNYNASATAGENTMAPVNTTKYYSYSEILVDSTVLVGMGEISGVTFYIDSVGGADQMTNCEIFMANTSSTSMSSFLYDTATFMRVFSGDISTTLVGPKRIKFDDPFVWDGHSNVIVAFHYRNNSYNSFSSIHFSAHESNVNKVYYGASNTDFSLDQVNLLSSSNRGASNMVPDLALISCLPTCYEPVVSSINTTSSSAEIRWYNENAIVEVSIRATGDPTWDSPIEVNNDYRYTYTGLAPITSYDVRLRRVCDDDEYSDWVEVSFTTDTACSIPFGLTVSNITADGATFSWTDGPVVGNRWEIHVWSDDIDRYYDVTSNPATVTGLVRASNYHAEIRAYCASDNHVIGEWSEAVLFDNVCYPPTALTASLQSNGDVVLNWTPGERNTQWVVAYGYRGFFLNDQLGYVVVNTPTATISGLTDVSDPRAKSTDGTTYGFRVRAICSSEWNSDWNSEEVLVHISNVGIDDVNGNVDFTLQPNPASDRVTLVLGEFGGDATVSILSVDGRQMAHFVTVENRVSVDLKDYASGTYFVQVQTADGISVRKLVVR